VAEGEELETNILVKLGFRISPLRHGDGPMVTSSYYPRYIHVADKHQKDIIEALEALKTETDRGAGIIGATILDLALTHSLKNYLHKNQKLTDAFFAITGPVGDLGPKVDLAFLICLIGEEAYRDLITVKNIRNYFAHRLNVSNFKSEAIATLSRNLKIAETRLCPQNFDYFDAADHEYWMWIPDRAATLADPRERFILSVHLLCYGLSLAHETAMPPPRF